MIDEGADQRPVPDQTWEGQEWMRVLNAYSMQYPVDYQLYQGPSREETRWYGNAQASVSEKGKKSWTVCNDTVGPTVRAEALQGIEHIAINPEMAMEVVESFMEPEDDHPHRPNIFNVGRSIPDAMELCNTAHFAKWHRVVWWW